MIALPWSRVRREMAAAGDVVQGMVSRGRCERASVVSPFGPAERRRQGGRASIRRHTPATCWAGPGLRSGALRLRGWASLPNPSRSQAGHRRWQPRRSGSQFLPWSAARSSQTGEVTTASLRWGPSAALAPPYLWAGRPRRGQPGGPSPADVRRCSHRSPRQPRGRTPLRWPGHATPLTKASHWPAASPPYSRSVRAVPPPLPRRWSGVSP